MACRFVIKRVSPSVPIFTNYVAYCTGKEGNNIFIKSGDCPECPDCTIPVTVINYPTPQLLGTVGGQSLITSAADFYNMFITPYLEMLNITDGGAANYRLHFSYASPVTAGVIDTDEIYTTGPDNEELYFYSTYFSTPQATFTGNDTVLFDPEIHFNNFAAGTYSLIIEHVDATEDPKYVVLNNLFSVS